MKGLLIILLLLVGFTCSSQKHPSLSLTEEGVKMIRAELGTVKLFDKALEDAKLEVDKEIQLGVIVPIPKDMAGGYTHERHKRNFFILQKAGNLYQVTGEVKYADYIKESLMAYAKMYPTLPLHPTNKSYATGKIFWQCLNDANWLVYVSQAYDCIYDFLSVSERTYLEKDLFRPFAEFLSKGNPKFFNRIHNHSTWANAAVGMIGLVMDDKELIQWSLYGLPNDGISEEEVDNDGGYIKVKGLRVAGFLAQLDLSFAPDGYFTEGPYYLRYAIFPFLVYAKALNNNMPELDILNYRDGILSKAVDALLQQTDGLGRFFPLNDAQKGMSIEAREIVTAVDVMYTYRGENPTLLSVAKRQNKVLLDETGFAVAKALKEGKEVPFVQRSVVFGDGEDGLEGGVTVLRANDACLVMKYSAQGMGHGHFDKLSYSYYDDSGDVIQDYGAVRWVNIDQKGGGRYLPENKTFGKQSIGHNTLVVNETSHYEGSVKKGEEHHPDLYYVDVNNEDLQLISAKENFAYPDTKLHRSLFLLNEDEFSNPLIIDIYRANSNNSNQYDLPLWFMGHVLSADFEYDKSATNLQMLGNENGYQHLWKEAEGKSENGNIQITWFGNSTFYTMTSTTENDDQLIFARLGANDPNFNLRNDPVFIHRRKNKKTSTFVNVIESHGTYDYITETPIRPFSEIERIELVQDNDDYTLIRLINKNGIIWTLAISNKDNNKSSNHELNVDSKKYSWQGVYKIFKNDK